MSGHNSLEQQFYIRLALWLTLLAICAALPFATYQLLFGDIIVSMAAYGIVIAQSLVALYLLRGGSGHIGVHLLAVSYTAGTIAVMLLTPSYGHYWLFPVVVANFYILPLRSAVTLNLIIFAASVPMLWWSFEIGSRYLANLTMVGVFGFVFSKQIRKQQDVLNQMAMVDVLTGVANRRALDAELQRITEERRYGARAALIMFDLDGFKGINDKYGHSVGDAVICRVANLVKTRIRASDQLYRYGGEEFVIVCRHQNVDEAAGLAENLREMLVRNVHPTAGLVTASFGVAEWHQGERLESWLGRADAMLYRAKHDGRNLVRIDPAPDPALVEKVRFLPRSDRRSPAKDKPGLGVDS